MSMDRDAPTPLYHRIKEELRAAIRRQEYTPGSPFITQREVCERYGVSTTTAIRALNDLVAEGVLVRRRGRGTFVTDQTETDATSRRPKPTSKSRVATIGCIVHGLEGPHSTSVVSGVESMCTELGYRMLLSDSYGTPEREAQALREAVDAGVAGVVAYPVQGRANTEVYAELRRRGLPLVVVDRYLPDLPTDAVVPDNFAVGYELTSRLIELGHERIATLWSETECTSAQERLAGYKQSLREHSLPVRPEFSALRRYSTYADGTDPTYLPELLALPEPPTVLLCANGFVLAAAAKNLLELGIEIPDQMELAGMDTAGPFDPLPITTVAAVLPSRELGREAMRILAKRIAEGYDAMPLQHIVLPITVTSRGSAAGYLRAVASPRD
ncbi:MAG TPA: GntR family transcriptional regulator [Actinopolymorphaceae bacterium]|jgi:DNA-binding LacI/PurR family transcriptional regulator